MKKWILIIIAVFVAAFIAGSIIAVKTASRLIEEKKQNILGLALDIKAYHVDWARAKIVLEGVLIYPAGKIDEREKLASAEKLIVAVSPKDILKKKELHATEIIFEKPQVSYIRYTRKSKNWDALNLSELGGNNDAEENAEKKKKPDDGFSVRIDSLTVNDGSAVYENHADGGRLELKNLNVEVKNIVPEPDPKKLPTAIAISAQIGNTSGKFTLKGKANLLSKGINFTTTSTLSPMPVTYFQSFYAGKVPFAVTSGSISLSSNATATESILSSNHHITISGLRVGGDLKADLINKFILSQNDRITANAAVNGDLSTGDISVSHTASKVIVSNLMDGAMKQASIGQAAEAVKESGQKMESGGRKIGEKIKGIFGR